MGNYTPNPVMTQPTYDPAHPFVTPSLDQLILLKILWTLIQSFKILSQKKKKEQGFSKFYGKKSTTFH